jgi:hypothetical protein
MEKLLWSISQKPNAIRSHLASWTGDKNIDEFLGLDLSFESVLPPLKRNQITGHKVINATELLHVCKDNGTLAEFETIEIVWEKSDFESSNEGLFDIYFSQVERTKHLDYFHSKLYTGINSGLAKNRSLSLSSKFIESGQKVVFCNVRRGEIAFVETRKLTSHIVPKNKPSHYYVFSKKYIDSNAITDERQGFRFIPIDTYVNSIYKIIERHGRDSLFIVVSTDGYSKLFEQLSRSPDLIKPFDNSLIEIINSEFAEIKQLSDLFLPGDSVFHTRLSIVYAAIANVLISGPSGFPTAMKRFIGFPDYAEKIVLNALKSS